MIWRRDKSFAERENMQHRGSSDSRATADSHCAAQGSRNEMEMSRQRSCRDEDVLLIWLVKLQERVKRVDTFVCDRSYLLYVCVCVCIILLYYLVKPILIKMLIITLIY